MDNASKIKQLLQQITGTEQSVFLFRPMEVVSVEGDTCLLYTSDAADEL